jgi:hypothetical protein
LRRREALSSPPPIAAEDFSGRYRQIYEMVLYGCAVMPKRK